jgi:hypothetical protein
MSRIPATAPSNCHRDRRERAGRNAVEANPALKQLHTNPTRKVTSHDGHQDGRSLGQLEETTSAS